VQVTDEAREALATVLGADKAAAALRHAPQRYAGDGAARSIWDTALVRWLLAPLRPLVYSDEKVANREIKVWDGATEYGRIQNPSA
jgi:hypothetical protein